MNFIQSSVNTFRSVETASLAKLVYTNLICGIGTVALVASTFPTLGSHNFLVSLQYLSFGAIFCVPLIFSYGINRLSNAVAYCLYYGYAAALGTIVSPYLIYYGASRIATALLLTSLGFVCAVSLDRSNSSSITDTRTLLYGSLILIFLSLIQLFLRLTLLELGICSLGIALCIGYTSYLVHNLRRFSSYQGPDVNRLAILVSLSLLQQLTSMFLYILRFLGLVSGRRRN